MSERRRTRSRVESCCPTLRRGSGRRRSPPASRPSFPRRCFGATAPSNRINVGAIGTGRISRGHDLPGIWKFDTARIMAVCDLDRRRMEDAKTLVNGYYAKKTGKPYDGVTGYLDYRELLANKDVDARASSARPTTGTRSSRSPRSRRARTSTCRSRPRSPSPRAGRVSDAVHRIGPHLPDRQPAAVGGPVPLRGGAGAQRAHRPAQDGARGPAGRSRRATTSRRCRCRRT